MSNTQTLTRKQEQDLRSQQTTYRYRVAYPKRGRLRHLGHLELIGTLDRTIRRAGLPFAITNGFAPRMKAQFSAALPVGCSSVCEYFDVWLTRELDPASVLQQLQGVAAPDLMPRACRQLTGKIPALEASLTRHRWVVRIALDTTKHDLDAQTQALIGAVESLLAEGTFKYLRGEKQKELDLTQCVCHLSFEAAPAEKNQLYQILCRMETQSSNLGALRPQLLLDAAARRANIEYLRPLRVVRLGQWVQEDGYLVDALDGHRFFDPYR